MRSAAEFEALLAASALGGLGQSLAGTAGSLLTREVTGSEVTAGLPQTAVVTGAAVSAVGLSRLAARRGRSVALSTGGVIAVAGCLILAVAAAVGSVTLILAGSLLLGAGNTAVMLGRYAGADLDLDAGTVDGTCADTGNESGRARRMASVLVAITVGAVAGPNLLAPAGALASAAGLPAFVGVYLLAGAAFAAAAGTLAVGLPTGSAALVRQRPATAGRKGVTMSRRGRAGLGVLGVANLVMVAVMTMAPIELHRTGSGLSTIGLVVSAHIAAMFAPSPLSAWLVGRFGSRRAAALSGIVLTAACAVAVVAGSTPVLVVALLLLGLGWNIALIAGSSLVTADVPADQRTVHEGWGDIGMGVAAAGGGAASGPVMSGAGYSVLAACAGVFAALVLPIAQRGSVQDAPTFRTIQLHRRTTPRRTP